MIQILFMACMSLGVAFGADEAKVSKKGAVQKQKDETEESGFRVKYKKQQVLDFEALLVEGQMRRPKISVVTGNTAYGADGVLKVRSDFSDRMESDFGGEDQ